jgi:hypothetical protein
VAANDPSTPSLAYNRMRLRWALLRAVQGGTETMRLAGVTFLPRYLAEDQAGYADRVNRSFFTNIFEESVQNVISRPFSRPVALAEDVKDPFRAWSEDIDLQGNNIDQFLRALAEDAWVAGFSGVLVDYPTVGEGATLADERSAGARPYWVHYRAEDIIAAYSAMVAGRRVWTHVRLRAYETSLSGFEEVLAETILVLERDPASASPVAWTKWQKGEKEWTIAGQGVMTLFEIPFVMLYSSKRVTDGECKPPFLDLAHKNVEHWQSSSDQRNILTMGRFAMLAVAGSPAGLDNDGSGNITLGPKTILQTTDVNGKFYFVEPAGHAIQAGERDLDRLERQMRVMGLGPHLQETAGDITATERTIDEARATSQVQAFALSIKDAAELAFVYTVLWTQPTLAWEAAMAAGPEIDINLDYGVTPEDSTHATTLLAAYTAGVITKETLWTELTRIGILGPGFDAEEEAARLETEPPALTGEGSGTGRQPADQEAA